MDKKGDFGWDELGKIIIAVIFFLILLVIVGLLTGKGGNMFETIKNVVRFGR